MTARFYRNHLQSQTALSAFGLLFFILLISVTLASPARVLAGDDDHAPAHAQEGGAHDEGGHGEEAHAGGDGHGEGGISTHLPNLIAQLDQATGHAPWAVFLHKYQNVVFSYLVIILLTIVVVRVYKNRKMIPGPLQNVVELLVDSMANFIEGILGPEEGRRFVPFLGTLFFYILFMNFFGLIPLMHSPTSAFNTTLALAICVFMTVQVTGVIRLGIGGYLFHLAGEPRGVIGWSMIIIMLPLHVIGEFAKPVSLALRLFGNVMGEDTLLAVFLGLGVLVLHVLPVPVGIPLHLPFIFLALLTSTIQALVFTLLSTIYVSQVLPHDHDEEHNEEHEKAASVA